MDNQTIQTPAPDTAAQDKPERPSLDMLCKMLFKEKVILARIMHECIPEYKKVPLAVIRDKLIEGVRDASGHIVDRKYSSLITGSDKEDSAGAEGTVIFDILFTALLPGSDKLCGIRINLEIQANSSPGYPLTKRGVFYCCRIISMEKGQVFEKSDYSDLEKVYSIWILTDPPADRRNTMKMIRLVPEDIIGYYYEDPANYDLICVIMINLGGNYLEMEKDILQYLTIVTNTKLTGKEKVKLMKENYGEEWPKSAERSAEEMYTLEDKVRDEGRIEGEAQGVIKGKIEGKIEERINSIRTLMHTMPCDIHRAMDLLLIPLDARPQYQSAICGM